MPANCIPGPGLSAGPRSPPRRYRRRPALCRHCARRTSALHALVLHARARLGGDHRVVALLDGGRPERGSGRVHHGQCEGKGSGLEGRPIDDPGEEPEGVAGEDPELSVLRVGRRRTGAQCSHCAVGGPEGQTPAGCTWSCSCRCRRRRGGRRCPRSQPEVPEIVVAATSRAVTVWEPDVRKVTEKVRLPASAAMKV